jgi:hypothetical protein
MPLLATDQFGRVYQTEGLSEFDTGVGYYPEMGDSDNLYLDEIDPVERKRLRALRNFKKRQALIRRKKELERRARQRRINAAIAARKARANALIKKAQERRRQRLAQLKLARIKASKNPYANYDQPLVGNPLSGWEEGTPITTSRDWQKLNVSNVPVAQEFGSVFYQQIEHPLAGFGYIPSDKIDGTMGFFRMPRISPPRISWPRINVPKIRPPQFRPPKISLPKVSLPQVRLPNIKLPPVKIPKLSDIVHEASKAAGAMINAPLHFSRQVLTHVPLVKDVYKGVDNLTGGTVESLYRSAMLPGNAMQGKPVSQAEFIEAVSNAAKVGTIVATGGAAVSLISAGSSALAKGPLGKTPMGKTLLSVGEVASLSTIGKQSLTKVLEQKAIDEAKKQAATEAGKKGGILGSIAASAATGALAKGAGFGVDGGKELPLQATSKSVAKTSQIAEAAGKEAAKKAAEAVKTSGLKFDTAAAQQEFINQAQEQAKRQVALEFQKKTGVPFDAAQKLARGEFPTKEEIYNSVKNEFYGTTTDLKNRLAQIPSQMKNADELSKKFLLEKQEMLAKELANREKLVNKVKEESAKSLVEANKELVQKADIAKQKQDLLKEMGKKHDELAQKVQTANLADRPKLAAELDALQKEIVKVRKEYDIAAKEAEEAGRKAQYEKEKGSILVLQAEYGGQGAREKYLSKEDSSIYEHPMLQYGLIERKS